ncbi:MAG TPA: 6-phosphogluconolactonase, partial [Acidimicrobiales bacterium]
MTHHELRRFDTAEDAAQAAAGFLLDEAVSLARPCSVALSGGRTPTAMFDVLAALPLPWERITLLQVDERVAPDGDDARNLTHLEASLAGVPATIEPMEVTAFDLEAAAARYAATLPARLDVVHLGLGPDGHTASLVPGDPVLDVTDRLVALTEPYQGTRRMTLTYPALARADRLLWLVAGADKREALQRLLDGDASIPAGRV